MSKYPWDILGIEPTSDELAIRRAYARMLKQYRPDEDPEGFAKLVRARELALQWCLADNQDDLAVAEDDVDEASANEAEAMASSGCSETNASQGFSSREFGGEVETIVPPEQPEGEASQNFSSREFGGETETTVPPEQPEANASQNFSSRDINTTVVSAETSRFDARAQAAAFAATMRRLRELIEGVDKKHPGPIWDADKWCAALAGMSELAFEHRRLLREFIVREAFPFLPTMQAFDAAANDMREGCGPGSVVAVWEDEFSIVQDQSALARLCGAQAMLRYLAWFALAERLRPLNKRSDAERHVIERLAALLPPGRQQKWDITLPKEAWALQRWQELFGLIRQLRSAEYARCRVFLADRLMAWLPVAPADTLSDLRTDSSPAAVVEAIEREFDLLDQRDASKAGTVHGPAFAEPADATRYKDWLDHVRRLRELEQRLARGKGAYRDKNGIAIIPADDIALGALTDASAIELAEAQRSGRWRLNFEVGAFFLCAAYIASLGSPLLATALAAIEIAAIPVILMLTAVAPEMHPHPGTIILSLLVACRALLACMLTRLSVAAAASRVRRADRAGVVARESRHRMVTMGRFGYVLGNFVGALELPLIFMVLVVVLTIAPKAS